MRRIVAIAAVVAGCDFVPGSLVQPDADPNAPDADPLQPDADPNAPDARVDAEIVGFCPPEYIPIGSLTTLYRVVEGAPLPWQEASADCDDDDDSGAYAGFTHLVVVGDENERITLTTMSTSPMISGNTWIGFSDLDSEGTTEGTFVWVTDEIPPGVPDGSLKPPWDTDDPDDAGGEEDCVRFKNAFVFEDKPCKEAQSYVCECDAYARR